MIKITKTKFKGLLVFEGINYADQRGYLREVFLQNKIKKQIKFNIVSNSKKNILRGLHFQKKKPQGKYVSVLKGRILDVVVDLRRKSSTFAKTFSIILSQKNCRSIYIPPGFAHGFLTLDNENIVYYGCTEYRSPKNEFGINYNDPTLNIKWTKKKMLLSKKDRLAKTFNELLHNKII
jgi:dTDP-4-dehydrorhamnose 3,5-epimerase